MDFMGYLLEQWKEKMGSGTIEDFVEFARLQLTENPPVSFDYVSKGLGVTFKDTTRVNFLPTESTPEDTYVMYQGEVAVTNTNRTGNLERSPYVKV